MGRKGMKRAGLVAGVAGMMGLGACTGPVAETTVPLIGAGDRLPTMAVKREVPSGTGDMVFIREEALRGGVRYVLSTPSGRVGSVAVQTVRDAPLDRLRVEEGEARALYLAQLRLNRADVETLARSLTVDGRPVKLPSAEAGADELYIYGFVALVRSGTEAPRLALVECQSARQRQDHRLAGSAAGNGLTFHDDRGRPAKDGILQVKDRAAARMALLRYIQERVTARDCHADRPLELGNEG